MVTTFVIYPKEADVDSTGCKHGHLELGTDWRTAPGLGANRRHEFDIGLNVTLGLAGEALDTPHNGLLFRFILGTAKGMLDLGLGSVLGHWNLDDDVCGKQLVRKVGNDLQVDRQSATEKQEKENVKLSN